MTLYAEAWRLNSLNPATCIGEVIGLTMLGRLDEARDRARAIREVDPDSPLENWQRCMDRWYTHCAHATEMKDILTARWNEVFVAA